MANSKSATKRVKQNEARRQRNRAVKTRVRNSIRTVREAMESSGVAADAEAKLQAAIQTIDKARTKGVLHKKNAARKISRLTKRLNAKKQATA